MDVSELLVRALPLLLAHAEEMRSCAALAAPPVASPPWRTQVRTQPEVPLSVAVALCGAQAARDAAGARARLACVCRAARLAADAGTPAAERAARAAHALACVHVAAVLVSHGRMRRGAAALKRLCGEPEPPYCDHDAPEFDEHDEAYAVWLDTWPGFMQRVTDAE
jgi:hypothetical protein